MLAMKQTMYLKNVLMFISQVGLSRAGIIQALELDIYSNGGYAMDLSNIVGALIT